MFTDIHTHILPAMDDGADDFEMAFQMLRQSRESGVKRLVLTPHFGSTSLVKTMYEEFKYKLEEETDIPEVLLGMEYMIQKESLESLNQSEFITINQSRYLLIEFTADESQDFVVEVINKLKKKNLVAVLAHLERYSFIQRKPSIASQLSEMGTVLQLNKDSIFGAFGEKAKRTAKYLLERELVHVAASDAHDTIMRNADFVLFFDYMIDHYSEEYAYRILAVNPELICKDQSIKYER